MGGPDPLRGQISVSKNLTSKKLKRGVSVSVGSGHRPLDLHLNSGQIQRQTTQKYFHSAFILAKTLNSQATTFKVRTRPPLEVCRMQVTISGGSAPDSNTPQLGFATSRATSEQKPHVEVSPACHEFHYIKMWCSAKDKDHVTRLQESKWAFFRC